MNILTAFFAWRTRRRLDRIAVRAERERNALMRMIAYRETKHLPRSYLHGDLLRATHTSMAAGLGRDWEAR